MTNGLHWSCICLVASQLHLTLASDAFTPAISASGIRCSLTLSELDANDATAVSAVTEEPAGRSELGAHEMPEGLPNLGDDALIVFTSGGACRMFASSFLPFSARASSLSLPL